MGAHPPARAPRKCITVMISRAMVALVTASALAVPASAQQTTITRDAQAQRLYQAGQTAFNAGEYDSALQLFESAYELSNRPGLLYNMGHCADRLRRDEDAIRWFDAYLQAAPADAPNRYEAEQRLQALREAEVARRVTPSPTMSTSHDMTNEIWFWPAMGGGAGLIVGGIIVGIVLVAQPQPEPGNLGGVVMAIQGRM